MSKQDKASIQLLKDLEALTDRHGSYSLAKPVAQARMRSLVDDFVGKVLKEK
jgi:hypothetical protein